MSSLGSGASSGSGSKRSPSSQKDVVQQDIKLHQDCDRSSRQRERLTGPDFQRPNTPAPIISPVRLSPRSWNSANNIGFSLSFFPFVKTKTLLLGYQRPHLKHNYLLKKKKDFNASLSTTDVKQRTVACRWLNCLLGDINISIYWPTQDYLHKHSPSQHKVRVLPEN